MAFERSKRADEFRVAAAANVVHAIAEQQSQRVGPGPQQGSDIVSIVENGLIVFRPTRRQQIVTRPAGR